MVTAESSGSVLDLASPATATDPLSHTTAFGYDTKGNLTTITNTLNKIMTITADTHVANRHDLPGRDIHQLQL